MDAKVIPTIETPSSHGSPYAVGETSRRGSETQSAWQNSSSHLQAETSPPSHGSPYCVGGTSRRGSETQPALLRACQEFESIFILQLWRAMQRTVPSQSKTLNYTEMFDVQLADHLAKHGRFGLAEQLYEQLSKHTSPPTSLSASSEGVQAAPRATVSPSSFTEREAEGEVKREPTP